MFSDSTKFEADPEVVACAFGDGVALLDLRTGEYFTINDVGAFVWGMLAQPAALGDIAAAVMERYQVEQSRCADDLQTLLRQLTETKLVRAAGAEAL